jgi:competence protein ComEC
LLGRPASTTRRLLLAVIALLLVDPFLLHSLGFALSAAASAGIALTAAPISRRLPGPRWCAESLAV